jgi:hypothetical protein
MPGINIVGMVCDYDRRHPEKKKVAKILEWPTPKSTKDARGFIGLMVYYRIFIISFSIIAAPIFQLFRKGKWFDWDWRCQEAMDQLKRRITETPVLITLDFSPSALPVTLHVDASMKIGWGAIMSQMQEDGRL